MAAIRPTSRPSCLRGCSAVNELPNFPANYNLAPTQLAPVVRRHPDGGERHLDLLRWGFLPYWTKEPKQARKPINAKAETVATTGMFRDAFARRRCLVPAAAFYEWRKGTGEVERTFAIITTGANDMMAPIHNRMPVVIEAADWPVWLGEAEGDPVALLRPAGEKVLRLWPISPRVNAVRNNDAGLIQPVEMAE